MRFDIMTLFPEMMRTCLMESIIGRAAQKGLFELYFHNIRDYSKDKHRRVDDYPYGGGCGMVMAPPAIYDCFNAICEMAGKRPHCIYMSPQGQVFNQQKAAQMTQMENIVLLCGHYEGIDERVIEEIVDEELSIGDFVLTGGEIPAMAVVDTVCRMLPGVLSSKEGFERESHYDGLLEYPQYTRPYVWRGKEVPEVLISGHHANVDKWRYQKQLERTYTRRPDMLKRLNLSKEDIEYLDSITKKNNL